MTTKSKEEFQAAINDVRRVLEQHGVVMVATNQFRKGATIELLDAAMLKEDPSMCYKWFTEPPHEGVKLDELHPFNKVEYEVVHTPMVSRGRVQYARIKAIGDVEGVIPTRITVHQHLEGISEVNVANTVDVESLEAVEVVPFVKYWSDLLNFTHFECGVGDGPFGTLVAYGRTIEKGPRTALGVVGFIEGPKPEELVKKWPAKGVA
ncbi:hypothetical protein [Burkholderia phage FLC9]|nr:hypothetical protein [Burkholderia phage FLC9]